MQTQPLSKVRCAFIGLSRGMTHVASALNIDFAEERASRRIETRMADWLGQTDRFLAFTERDVLKDAGRVSHERMERIAHERFASFDASRRATEAAEAEREAMREIETLEREAMKSRKPGAKT